MNYEAFKKAIRGFDDNRMALIHNLALKSEHIKDMFSPAKNIDRLADVYKI